MSDVVKAEVRAVRDLKRGVARYADQVRNAVADARREAKEAERTAREAVDTGRSRLKKSEAAVGRARDDLARCPEERRREHQAAVRAAEDRAAAARREVDQARKAERAVVAATADLAKVLCMAEAAVGDQSSAATAALAVLDTKLSEITSGGMAALARGAIVTLGVAAEVATTLVDGATLIGNVSQGSIPTADRITSTTQMQELVTERDQQLWAEVEVDRRKRESGASRRDKGEGD